MTPKSQYWVPCGLPEHLQVGLSIPGAPPKTTGEHRNRFWALMETLAEELDENTWTGAASECAYEFVPDQALYLEGKDAKPSTVIHILSESDFLTSQYITDVQLGPGDDDPELIERCQEASFQDRLTCLTME